MLFPPVPVARTHFVGSTTFMVPLSQIYSRSETITNTRCVSERFVVSLGKLQSFGIMKFVDHMSLIRVIRDNR